MGYMVDIFKKKYLIHELKEGQIVDDIFVVKIKKRFDRYKSGYFFNLILSDRTGRTMDYTYWGPDDESKVRALYSTIKQDCVVHVQGRMSMYNNKMQLTTNSPSVIEALKEGEYDRNDFVKPAKRDVNKMYSELKEAIALVKNKDMKKLLEDTFSDPDIEEKFRSHPGAIEIHHNWTGGLLQHSLEVLDYCMTSKKQFPALDQDLLIAGALLHDIGKIEELEITTRIKGTEKGQLIGHLSLGLIFISKKIDGIEGFDREIKNKVLHLIASHHGKKEYGTVKEPMFPEAMALYYADEASAKIAEILEFVDESKNDTEDSFMYHKRHARNIFLR